MKFLYLTLNWLFGLFFILVGLIIFLAESPLAGIPLILIAAILLPPTRKFFTQKAKKELSVKARAITISLLFIAFGMFAVQSQNRKNQEAIRQAQEVQTRIENFNKNRTEIISSIRNLILEKDFNTAASQSSRYLFSNDPELQKINAEAKKELVAIQEVEKRKQLLTESASASAKSDKSIPRLSYKVQAMAATKLDVSWSKSGFGSVMMVNFTITNDSDLKIKDIKIRCTHYSQSGTKIDQNTSTIYEIIEDHSKKIISDFNMGFIHTQVHSTRCEIRDLVIASIISR